MFHIHVLFSCHCSCTIVFFIHLHYRTPPTFSLFSTPEWKFTPCQGFQLSKACVEHTERRLPYFHGVILLPKFKRTFNPYAGFLLLLFISFGFIPNSLPDSVCCAWAWICFGDTQDYTDFCSGLHCSCVNCMCLNSFCLFLLSDLLLQAWVKFSINFTVKSHPPKKDWASSLAHLNYYWVQLCPN